MLALALVLEGLPREVAAKTCGMVGRRCAIGCTATRQRGLWTCRLPREARSLTSEQATVVAELMRTGSDLATHDVVHWLRADLAGVIEQRFGVRPTVRTVGKFLRRLDFRRLSVRPQHPGHDAVTQEAHKETSPASLQIDPEACSQQADRALVARRARVGQQGILTRIGPPRAAGHRRRAISAIVGPICSARSAPPATSAQAWSCRLPTVRP